MLGHQLDTGEVAERMEDLARKLEKPALTDVHVAWPSAITGILEAYPNPQPDLYAGEPIAITARLPGQTLAGLTGEIILSGRHGGRTWERSLSLAGGQDATGVAALWARAKIAQFESDGVRCGDWYGVRPAVLKLALRYALVTPYTSLVAIDERPARHTDVPLDSGEIARNLPAGWHYGHVFGQAGAPAKLRALPPGPLCKFSAESSIIEPPRTATPSLLMILSGHELARGRRPPAALGSPAWPSLRSAAVACSPWRWRSPCRLACGNWAAAPTSTPRPG